MNSSSRSTHFARPMPRGRSDPFIGAGIGLSVFLFVGYVFPGFWAPVNPHFEGECQTVALAASAEDLLIDPTSGVVYLTYYDRVLRENEARANQGSVMMLDLNAAEPRVRAALATEVEGMVPSGIALYAPPDGPKRLFVTSLSNRPGEHSIEVFEQTDTGHFRHVESIRDPMLWSPVAIVAVGPREFYVTNYSHGRARDSAFDLSEGREERRKQRRARATRTGVVYFDGERMQQVAPRVEEALGVAASPDGRTVYVAEGGPQRLLVYDRDTASGELTLRDRAPLLGSPQNLTVDASGSVWIGAHPKWFSYTRALNNPSVSSPTQVLKYTPDAQKGKRVTEVYLNRGEALSTGTVAAVYEDKLVIGSIKDRRLLVCTQAGLTRPVFSGPEKDT
jgi:arylesterase/paraoxonase